MIIDVIQTQSNFGYEYTIYHDEKYAYNGKLGSWHTAQRITLQKNRDTVATGVYRFSHWTNYIPLRYLFGEASIRNLLEIPKFNGTIALSLHGFARSFYVITASDHVLHAYRRSIGDFSYLSVYLLSPDCRQEEQIALAETYLTTTNYLYTHKIYLLDAYAEQKDIVSMLMLYVANRHYTHRGSGFYGKMVEKEWTFSTYNDKYDPSWRETHFPNENYWGKINP